jgi:hypothetical protein
VPPIKFLLVILGLFCQPETFFCHSEERSNEESHSIQSKATKSTVDPSLSLRVTMCAPVLDSDNVARVIEEEIIAELLKQYGGCRQPGAV